MERTNHYNEEDAGARHFDPLRHCAQRVRRARAPPTAQARINNIDDDHFQMTSSTQPKGILHTLDTTKVQKQQMQKKPTTYYDTCS